MTQEGGGPEAACGKHEDIADAAEVKIGWHKKTKDADKAHWRGEAGKSDSCGVRTHALSEWRLKPPP